MGRDPVLAVILIWLLTLPLHAQQAGKVKAQASGLPTGGKVTLNMLDGAQYCGTVASLDADSLTIHEVDLKQELTLRYDAIQRIRKGFGRPGVGGRRVHPRTGLIAGLAIVGALLVIVVVAVASDKS